MEKDLESLSTEELKSFYENELSKNEKLKSNLKQITYMIEETERNNEKKEEKVLNSYSHKIHKIKKHTEEVIKEIQKAENYMKNTLNKQERDLILEKEKLEQDLRYQESQVINQLQNQLDKLAEEIIILESDVRRADHPKIKMNDEKMQKLLDDSEKTIHDYQKELAALETEHQHLQTNISILNQRIASLQNYRNTPLKAVSQNQLRKTRRNTE